MATATAPEVSRDTLEDRYMGLLWKVDGQSDDMTWSKLQADLSWNLTRLVAGTARVHPDDAGQIVTELHAVIHDHIIRRIDELGLARDFGVSEGAAHLMATGKMLPDHS
jgi:hypothetical protein